MCKINIDLFVGMLIMATSSRETQHKEQHKMTTQNKGGLVDMTITATMSDNRGGKLSCSNPFLYGNEDGSQDAALKVLLKWANAVNLVRTDDSDWILKRIGEDYRGDLIYTAHMA